MNYDNIRNCQSLNEAILEIMLQNYNIKTEQYVDKNTANNLQGLYLLSNNNIQNTIFDVWFHICEIQYCKLLEDKSEDTKKGSMILCLEVLQNWILGIYKILYPHSIEELIEIMSDEDKSEFVTRYLRGVCNRLANNSLYYKLNGDNNTISSKKYYIHEKGHKKTKNTYIYLDWFYLDLVYSDGYDGLSTGYDILDIEEYKNQTLETCEKLVFKESSTSVFEYLMHKKIITASNVQSIQRKLEEKVRVSIPSATTYINKIKERNDEELEAVTIKNNKIVYGGDFVAFGRKLMKLNTLEDKFFLIKKILQSRGDIARIIHDLITDLDTQVHVEFFTNIEDTRYVKYYVKSDNFRLILDVILNEYIAQQQRLKDIYCYNETQRREKLKQIEDALEKAKSKESGLIDKSDVTEIFDMTNALFLLDTQFSKQHLKVLKNKLEIMNVLGFNLTKAQQRNKFILDKVS